jgi:hypothetical protein
MKKIAALQVHVHLIMGQLCCLTLENKKLKRLECYLSGRKLQQFNIDQPGDQLYRYINSLSISHDGSRIYIADGYHELI